MAAPFPSDEVAMSSTIPASWFRDANMYELERRAIYSRTWILISHENQFKEIGKYVRYEMAGYSFVVVRNRQGEINAFLNACRHRAFPIVHQDEGKANIFSCKYHGWSYGLNGKLAKAPRFDSVSEFDKSEYPLYHVHTHIDKFGFLWINLDSSPTPSVSWESQFEGVDVQGTRLKGFNFKDYDYDHTWSLDGDFNWKTLVENYNECYHCSTAHPGIAPFINKESKFDIAPERYYIGQLGEDSLSDGSLTAAPTFMFPNASYTITPNFMYMMSIVPISATKSKMRYEFYRNINASDTEFQQEVDFFKQVENEDKWLSNNAQHNLNNDTYMAGPLHPYMERAVKYFEDLLRPLLREHVEKEKKLGRQIWAVRRTEDSKNSVSQDESFCRSLCNGNGLEAGAKDIEW